MEGHCIRAAIESGVDEPRDIEEGRGEYSLGLGKDEDVAVSLDDKAAVIPGEAEQALRLVDVGKLSADVPGSRLGMDRLEAALPG